MSYYVEELSPFIQLTCYGRQQYEQDNMFKCIIDGEYESVVSLLSDGIKKFSEQAQRMYHIDRDKVISDILNN